MAFTAKDVAELRKQTGCGMMDCKKALVESDGDFEAAVKYLREKGMAATAKKADRIAAEGIVDILTIDNTTAIVEVNSETDFVAKNATFQEFVKEILKTIIANKPADVDALLASDYVGGGKVSEALAEQTYKIGEKLSLRRFNIIEGTVATYCEGKTAPEHIEFVVNQEIISQVPCDELYNPATNIIKEDSTTTENIINHIIDARTKLFANNVSDASDIVIEVSPAVAAIILKAKIDLSTDNTDALETGCIGSIGGCKIFVSNNIASEDKTGATYYKCFARTKRAIAFASQLSEINAYRPEKRFADAVKGLHLFGAKVVYPGEMVLLDLGVAKA